MKNPRTYGKPPFTVAVVHGGPGAPGEMAPVARRLASGRGVLEPLQTASSLEGQVQELKAVIEKYATPPLAVVGYSWGAWLGLITASRFPALVKKLILVGSGGLEEKYAARLHEIRLSRLSEEERTEIESLIQILNDPRAKRKKDAFMRFGTLFSKADAYDPETFDSEVVDFQVDIFQSVWEDAAELRRSGKLLELAKRIQCPVTALHGDYDPHPAQGVQEPLSAALKDFRLILLERCGHKPWIERHAKEPFYEILENELR